jgi:hypothetical protein
VRICRIRPSDKKKRPLAGEARGAGYNKETGTLCHKREEEVMSGTFLKGLLTFAVLSGLAGMARADRTPSVRDPGMKSTGARSDITVPYLTNGKNAFRAYSVAPRVYDSPEVIDFTNPGARPVFNLIFYGSVLSFGTDSTGPVSRPK